MIVSDSAYGMVGVMKLSAVEWDDETERLVVTLSSDSTKGGMVRRLTRAVSTGRFITISAVPFIYSPTRKRYFLKWASFKPVQRSDLEKFRLGRRSAVPNDVRIAAES